MSRRIVTAGLAVLAAGIGVLALPVVASAFDVTGTKFDDQDADGVFDAGEPGIAGVTIYWDADNSDTFNAGDTSTTTSATGTYTLAVPNNGTRTVRELPPAGYECSHPSLNFALCEHSVTGPPNNTKPGRNFGNFARATISGTKFDDLDANGAFDAGEPGIDGVQIYIDSDGNNALDAGEPTTTTASGGAWSIGNLVPGTYTVREIEPAGYFCSAPSTVFADCEFTETLTSGEDDSVGQDFGNFASASISGTKFDDLDADGAFDAGEPPIQDVTIYIDDNGNDVLDAGESSTTTDASGNWSFSVLPPGTYTVREEQPAGYECSAPSTTFANCEFTETLTSGESDASGQDFGNFARATISGTKFEDLDASGTQDGGEGPLEGVTIYIDSDGNDALDAGEPTTTTDASGDWSFANLVPGGYTVREIEPAGYFCSAPSTTFANCEFTETLISGETDSAGQDFGNAPLASISGTKFDDLDANGAFDAGEPPLQDVTIHIDSDNNDALDAGEPSTTTDATGNWSFTSLLPGTYTVREVPPSGYSCSAPSTTLADCEFTETLSPGEDDNTGQDFGNFASASISGTKFDDLDANGTKDAGEPGIDGVQIYIDSDGNDVFDAGEPTTTTASGGAWSIGSLVPGTYTVRETEPAGYFCSAPSTTFANCEFTETLTSGENDTSGQDFGNFTTATISGTKFEDLDADGTPDAGEPGIAGVTIYLDADGNDALDGGETSTVTDGSGNWSFTGLNPGTQTVREVLTGTYQCSAPSTTFANCEFTEFLSSGETDGTGQDFGNFRPALLSGTKFNDANGNGTLDGGETGIPGVTIYIDADGNNQLDGGEASTLTDGTGNWQFGPLDPGTYTVREVPPAGTTCTAPSATFADCEFTETLDSDESDFTGQDFGNFTTPPGGGGGGVGGIGTTPAIPPIPDTRPTCSGKTATIVGTHQSEGIRGTAGNDVIFTGGGSDRIIGGAGNDTLCGGAGNDILTGGPGNDTLLGGGGKDRLMGGAGKDKLKGAGGADTCLGGGGRDKSKSCKRERGIP